MTARSPYRDLPDGEDPPAARRAVPGTYILRENPISALNIAIGAIVTAEEQLHAATGGNYRSAFRAGLEDNLATLRAGAPLEVRE